MIEVIHTHILSNTNTDKLKERLDELLNVSNPIRYEVHYSTLAQGGNVLHSILVILTVEE